MDEFFVQYFNGEAAKSPSCRSVQLAVSLNKVVLLLLISD